MQCHGQEEQESSCSNKAEACLEVELLEGLDVIRPRPCRVGTPYHPHHIPPLLVWVDKGKLEPRRGTSGCWLHLLYQICELPQTGIWPGVYLHLQENAKMATESPPPGQSKRGGSSMQGHSGRYKADGTRHQQYARIRSKGLCRCSWTADSH